MRLALAPFILFTVACAEPVVEMQLVMPKNATDFDTSCITAVEVRVNGASYPQVKDDHRTSCLEISGGTNYAAIRDAIRGKFELSIPETGLAGIEIYGWSGTSACDQEDPFAIPPNLLFFGNGDYIGQDSINLPITPNLSCANSEVKIRQVDMFKMVGGGTCADAMTVTDQDSWAALGTISPKLYGKGTEIFGGVSWGPMMSNLSTFTGPTKVGPKSCLVTDGANWNGNTFVAGATSCYIGGTPVCANAGEYEHPIIIDAVLATIDNLDPATKTKFPDITIGSVWSNAATKTPVANATVEVDSDHAKVIYVDPPNAQGVLAVRGDQTKTGPSGLFVLFSDTLVNTKVNANGASRSVMLGAADNLIAAAMIVVP